MRLRGMVSGAGIDDSHRGAEMAGSGCSRSASVAVPGLGEVRQMWQVIVVPSLVLLVALALERIERRLDRPWSARFTPWPRGIDRRTSHQPPAAARQIPGVRVRGE